MKMYDLRWRWLNTIRKSKLILGNENWNYFKRNFLSKQSISENEARLFSARTDTHFFLSPPDNKLSESFSNAIHKLKFNCWLRWQNESTVDLVVIYICIDCW